MTTLESTTLTTIPVIKAVSGTLSKGKPATG
jgi:hypothetical protein